MSVEAALIKELDEAESKAWDALGRYKFQMFGYWAAIWVHLNRIAGTKRPNPWREIVLRARDERPLTAEQQYANREKHGHFGAGHS